MKWSRVGGVRVPQLLLVVVTVAGCQTAPTTINTVPAGANVKVNDYQLGQSPQAYTFDFSKSEQYVITASKVGYYDTTTRLTKDSPDAKATAITVTLPPDEAWVATKVSSAANNWQKIPINPRYTKEQMWQRLVNLVTSRYSNIEIMDPSSGYIRVMPLIRTFRHPVRGEFYVRTKFLSAIDTLEPLVIKVRIDSDISHRSGQWDPYDRVFREDADLVEEISNVLGAK